MVHHIARAAPGRLLFTRDIDALLLWDDLASAFPEQEAACLMPDHLHLLLPHDDPGDRLRRVMAAHACRIRFSTGRRGPLWSPRAPAEFVPDAKHARRLVRYVHLNPCRAGLVADPLGWAFSTHRDRTGFAARPVVQIADDPSAFHRFVSADGTVDPAGTPLPPVPWETIPLERVAEAVSAVWRVPIGALDRRHPARRMLARAAIHLGAAPSEIRAWCGLGRTQLWEATRDVPARGEHIADPVLRACIRAANDRRFAALTADDHRRERAWRAYATRV